MDLTAALLRAPDAARTQPKPLPEPPRAGTSFADIANANRRAEARDQARENANRSDQSRADQARDRSSDQNRARTAGAEQTDQPDQTGDDPRFGYGDEDHGDQKRRGNRLDELPLDAAFIEAVRKVVGEAMQEATGKSSLFGGSDDGELFSEVTDLGKIASEALLLALAPTEGEGADTEGAGDTVDLVAELLAEGEALLGEGEVVPQIAGVAQTATPGDIEMAKPAPTSQPGTAAHAVSMPSAGENLVAVADGTEQVQTDTQPTTTSAAQPAADLKQPAQLTAPAADAAPVEIPRETREGERVLMAGPRSDTAGSDLARMQRVTGPAVLSQHHNGILVADTGHRNYEIRFSSAELGQIRVELQMDGHKPEASILYNNADAEKPLRDQFSMLQTRLAGLGIENLVLRQDTRGGWGDGGAGGFAGGQTGTGEAPVPGPETEYYLMVPELTADGRLDIRF